MSNVLDGLLANIDDSALRAAIADEVGRLRDTKQFGLVFERHLPETAKLTNHPVRRDALVQRRAQNEQGSGIVTAVAEGEASVTWQGGETEQVPTDELVVIARFGEPIYPGLKSLGRLERGGDKPFHTVINAENYHALQLLQFTHQGKVDVIYIDPPYNLGGDLTYNDKRVAKDDAFRHSKWLSFMDRRLRLARDLLRPTGAIIVAIDDTEQAHLRLLMDQVFGDQNFVTNVVWQGGAGRGNDSKYVSVGHDYMLIYARSKKLLDDADTLWRERKPGYHLAMRKAVEVWEEHAPDAHKATEVFKKWIRGLPRDVVMPGVSRYDHIDEHGRVYNPDKDLGWPGGGGPRYDILHPKTKKPVKIPSGGWRFSEERMAEEIALGNVAFGDDENKIPRGKLYLEDVDSQVVPSVFEQGRTDANTALKKVLGEKRFDYPKDTRVLARWINLVTQERDDAVVLDFFVGSGSTVQAVLELNAADGGRRQCIAVTNNEVEEKQAKKLSKQDLTPGDPEWEQWGIFEYVTKPRLETLVTGKRPDGTKHSDGLDENIEFFELTYQDPSRVARGRAYADVAPLLWLRGGGIGPRIDVACDSYTAPDGSTYAVLFDPAYVRDLVADLDDREQVETVFIVTDSTAAYQQAAAELPAHVEPVRLYEAYLRNFELNTGDDL